MGAMVMVMVMIMVMLIVVVVIDVVLVVGRIEGFRSRLRVQGLSVADVAF